MLSQLLKDSLPSRKILFQLRSVEPSIQLLQGRWQIQLRSPTDKMRSFGSLCQLQTRFRYFLASTSITRLISRSVVSCFWSGKTVSVKLKRHQILSSMTRKSQLNLPEVSQTWLRRSIAMAFFRLVSKMHSISFLELTVDQHLKGKDID